MIRYLVWATGLLWIGGGWTANIAAIQDEQDFNRIIRPEPGPLAAKIGTAIQWEVDWDRAVARSKETGKPIFWYVPTLPGTFMDRKKEIDRYMLAGPFSWPPIIDSLNREYIPYRQPPSRAQAAQFQLKPYEFVEPGFLVLRPDLSVERRIDHLTTLQPYWLTSLIARQNSEPSADSPSKSELDAAWLEFRQGHFDAPPSVPASDPQYCESLLLAGMMAFRRGDHEAAKRQWQAAADAGPDSPLGWKAAAEAEGFGPFVRGMETYTLLPDRAMQAGVDSSGSAAPKGTYAEPEIWNRGVRFLLGMQASNGGFFDSDYDFGGYDSLPNVHSAVTAICGMALLASRDRVPAEIRAAVDSAISRAADYVIDPQHHNPRDRDEILWSYAYRVRFLSRLLEAGVGDRQRLQADLSAAVKALESIQLNNGRWYHEYTNPFVTATALSALFVAQQAGATPDDAKVRQGLQSLQQDRFENGAYPYYARESDRNRERPSLEASAGRMAICELALWYWQRIDDAQLLRATQTSLQHHGLLNRAYKYDNHTSTLAYGGFFFWYDMRARAEMIARIRDVEWRDRLAREQRQLVLDLPEVDGCFVDSHELGRCYGTAMALLSLELLDPRTLEPTQE